MNYEKNNMKDNPWVLEIFTPLLNELKFKAGAPICKVNTSSYSNLKAHSMGNCIIEVQRASFKASGDEAVFLWSHYPKLDMFRLVIFLHEKFFNKRTSCETTAFENQVNINLLGVHEFTHCVAAMLFFAKTINDNDLKSMKENMCKHTYPTTTQQRELLLQELSMGYEEIYEEKFPHKHFKLNNDDFKGNYSELYRQFLFSDSIYRQYLEDTPLKILQGLYKLLENKTTDEISKNLVKIMIGTKIKEIAKKESIHPAFAFKMLGKYGFFDA